MSSSGGGGNGEAVQRDRDWTYAKGTLSWSDSVEWRGVKGRGGGSSGKEVCGTLEVFSGIHGRGLRRSGAMLKSLWVKEFGPGMEAVCSGECFHCGGPRHGFEVFCPKPGTIPAVESDWRAYCQRELGGQVARVNAVQVVGPEAIFEGMLTLGTTLIESNVQSVLEESNILEVYNAHGDESHISSPFSMDISLRDSEGKHAEVEAMVDDGAMVAAMDVVKGCVSVKGVKEDGGFEVFDSGGSWKFLFGKPLLKRFSAVHDYQRDAIVLKGKQGKWQEVFNKGLGITLTPNPTAVLEERSQQEVLSLAAEMHIVLEDCQGPSGGVIVQALTPLNREVPDLTCVQQECNTNEAPQYIPKAATHLQCWKP
ncbi:hypothetical protein F5879DRAFT_927510 [Lentinula edodes]|nr:hypothetical protein F5879DRAFT_927510 [Lentinula edodes]